MERRKPILVKIIKYFWPGLIILWLIVGGESGQADFTVRLKNDRTLRLKTAQVTTVADFEEDVRLCIDTFVDLYKNIEPPSIRSTFATQEDVRNYLEVSLCQMEATLFLKGETVFVRAFLDETLVGLVTYELEPKEPHAFFVRVLAVDPAYHSMGIGRALLFAIKNDPELFPDTHVLFLKTRTVNEQALRFYRALGFKETTSDAPDWVQPNRVVDLRWSDLTSD